MTSDTPDAEARIEGPRCSTCGHPEGADWTWNGEESTGEAAHFLSGGGWTCLLCQYALIERDDYEGDFDPRWQDQRHEFVPTIEGQDVAAPVEPTERTR